MALSESSIPDIPIPDKMLHKLPSEPPSGHTALTPFLRQQGRALDSVLGDGNCLFRAMSKHLTGVEHHHSLLRKTIADFEAANQAVFSSLHTAINRTGFTEHLKNIKMPYVWGTSVEIMAAASLSSLIFTLPLTATSREFPHGSYIPPNLCRFCQTGRFRISFVAKSIKETAGLNWHLSVDVTSTMSKLWKVVRLPAQNWKETTVNELFSNDIVAAYRHGFCLSPCPDCKSVGLNSLIECEHERNNRL